MTFVIDSLSVLQSQPVTPTWTFMLKIIIIISSSNSSNSSLVTRVKTAAPCLIT